MGERPAPEILEPEPRGDQWALCPACNLAFRLSITLPCPVDLFVAALRGARCPRCGDRKRLQVYEPGRRPEGLVDA